MDEFCGSEFWNENYTWYTEDPDFTICFQRTVLIWIPCLFLWSLAILDVFYIKNSINRNVPWGFFNVTKLILTGAITLLTILDLGIAISKQNEINIYPVDYYTPVIKIASFVLSAVLLYYNRKHGLRTSGLLFLFWFLLLLLSIPQCRYEARQRRFRIASNIQDNWAEYKFVSFILFFTLTCIIWLLNCFADKEPLESKYPKTDNPCPESGASFLSRMFFAWFDKLAWKGYRNPLENKDLWEMNPEDTSKEIMPIFAKHWNKSVAKAQQKSQTADLTSKASYTKASSTVNITKGKGTKQASILPAICKAFGGTFLFGSSLKLAQDLLTFVSPQVLRLIIQYIDNEGDYAQPVWRGFFYAGLLFLVASVQTLFLAQYFQRMFIVGLRIRTALISAIYRKALVMSNSAKKSSTVGEVVNLMAVDAQRFMDLTAYINMIWSAPLQIALALYFLWDILGASVMAGLAVMIILIPVNGFIANKIKVLQIKQMKNKDERVKLMNEVLSGIKVLKLYAWEPSFEKQVLNIREKEIKVLKEAAYLNAGTAFIWSCAPFLVSIITFVTYIYSGSSEDPHILTPVKAFVCITLFDIIKMPLAMLPLIIVYMVEVALVTFAVFVLVDENNVLDAETAFVSLSLFNILRFPLSMLPMLITNMVQTSVSVKRINKFMNCEELDPENVQHEQTSKSPMTIDNGSFSWGDEEIVLRNINVRVDRSNLVAVVGTVGSGKSSLLSAFLGEMEKISGHVNTNGKIAYVAQQAWIQNCTLRDNILFGKPMDWKLYHQVINACALKQDLEMLPGGDETEIGEKGINLSGGQKQRVSLARAVYNNADIYLLDDPLSAVDSHVGKHIFEQVIGPSGILATKTRVLVTHGITYLPHVDNILVLKNGEITESGNYQTLLSRKGAFAEFLLQHLQEVNAEDENLDDIKLQLETTLGHDNEFIGKLERAISTNRSRTESNSDTGSLNGSLTRQISELSETNSAAASSAGSGGGGGGGGNQLRKRLSDKDIKAAPKEQKDKLIEQEKSEVGSVKWEVYKHYLKSIGITLSIVTILLNLVFQAFSIGSNIWLSRWSSDKNAGNDTAVRDMYLGVYGAFGAGQAFSNLIASLIMALGCLYAAKEMQEILLAFVFRWPMELFDTTPIGRVMNRFSKDVDVVDNILPHVIRSWIFMLFSLYFLYQVQCVLLTVL